MPVSYSIRIDFDKKEHHPERVFHAMALYIEGFNDLHSAFLRGYSSEIDISSSLGATREGSCIADICHKIKETTRNVDLSNILDGIYYGILESIGNVDKIDSINDVKKFTEGVQEIAAKYESDYDNFTSKPEANPVAVANALHKIDKAKKLSSESDTIQFGREVNGYKDLSSTFSCPRDGNQIFEKVQYTKPTPEILVLRRPSYIDGLKWEFDSPKRKKIIFATMSDTNWLLKWSAHEVQIWPGDALSVEVKYVIKTNDFKNKNRVIETDIIRVIRVIEKDEMKQLDLGLNNEN